MTWQVLDKGNELSVIDKERQGLRWVLGPIQTRPVARSVPVSQVQSMSLDEWSPQIDTEDSLAVNRIRLTNMRFNLEIIVRCCCYVVVGGGGLMGLLILLLLLGTDGEWVLWNWNRVTREWKVNWSFICDGWTDGERGEKLYLFHHWLMVLDTTVMNLFFC